MKRGKRGLAVLFVYLAASVWTSTSVGETSKLAICQAARHCFSHCQCTVESESEVLSQTSACTSLHTAARVCVNVPRLSGPPAPSSAGRRRTRIASSQAKWLLKGFRKTAGQDTPSLTWRSPARLSCRCWTSACSSRLRECLVLASSP